MIPSAFHGYSKRFCITFLLLLAAFGMGRGIVGAVHPLNPKYWDGSNDLQWSPSRVLLEGNDPYALYQELGPANNARVGSPFILSQWADYPPSSLMILWPLAALPWSWAKWCWLGVNLCSIAAILWAAQRLFSLRSTSLGWLILLFLACPSTCSTLKSGQHGLFSIAMFLLAVVFDKDTGKHRGFLAGLCLALSWLKYSITMPLSLFFLTRKRGVSFLVAATLHTLATGVAGWWTDTSPVGLLYGNLEVASGNLGLVAFDLSRTVGHIGLFGYVLLTSFLAGVILFAINRAKNDQDGEVLSMLTFFSFVLLPHLRYDLFMLVIPLAYALSPGARDMALSRLILCSVTQLWFVRELIETAIGQRPSAPELVPLSNGMLLVSLCLLYGPIVVIWLRLVAVMPLVAAKEGVHGPTLYKSVRALRRFETSWLGWAPRNSFWNPASRG